MAMIEKLLAGPGKSQNRPTFLRELWRRKGGTKSPIPLFVRRRIVAGSIRHLHGPKEVDLAKDEFVVVCLVRDGQPYLKAFVEHYFSLGAKHIVFLDNNSSDDTVGMARSYENVTVLHSRLPFKTYEILMRQYLISRFGKKRWSLCVDIDEFFDYPRSDVVSMRSLLRYLNNGGYTAVMAHMLDMFPEGPLSELSEGDASSFRDLHRFYDISDLIEKNSSSKKNVFANSEIKRYAGGIRRTLFGVNAALSKYPLIFSDGKVRPMDRSVHRANNAYVADISCVLLHYKFLAHFRDYVAKSVREGNYFRNSFAYRKYQEVLDRNPDLQIKRDTAGELRSVDDLVDNGFLVVSEEYRNWADAEEERRTKTAR